jgi:rsbT co-antagonist protein RsbR
MSAEGPRTVGDNDSTEGSKELLALRERVRALETIEAELREKLDCYESVQNALPDLLCVQHRDGRFLFANQAFCELYGKTPEAVVGSTDDRIVLAKSPEAHAERRAQVLTSGIFIDIPSEQLRTPSGVELPYNVLWCPLRSSTGEIYAVVIRARGLRGDEGASPTEERAATHTKALLSIIPDMYFRIDRSGTYIDFSAGRGLDTALPPSLFLGKRVQDVTPDVAPWAIKAMERALETGDVQTHEYKMFLQGTYVDYEARVLPSGLNEALFLVREISKQKKTEEKLREADAKFRAFEGQSLFGIFLVQDGQLRYTNPKLEAILGVSRDELEGKGMPLSLLDGDAPDQPILDAFLSEIEAQGESGSEGGVQHTFRARRRDGTIIYLDIFGAKVSYGGRPAVIGVVLDVTDVRQAEEEHTRLQEEMMRIQEAMMVELSTPLIPISDEILVMPLIGSVDDRRAQHVMERLLQGVASSRAKAVILDVTGMSSVTTQTASALVRCAQAARLLGARALMTGVRADVAQTLVTMDVDLSGIVTLSTLKAGIAYVMGMGMERRH